MDPYEERSARRLGATVIATFSACAALSFGVAFVRADTPPKAHDAAAVAAEGAGR
jgi:hypothetical protein